MTHKDSGYRCLVAHLDSEGRLLPACVKCSECGEWLRPEAFASGECLPTKHAPDAAIVPLSETKKAVDSGLPLKVDE